MASSSPHHLKAGCLMASPGTKIGSPFSQCQLCLERFETVNSLEGCGHTFCFWCVHRWSKNIAECPLCNCPFHSMSFVRCPVNTEVYDQHAKYNCPAPLYWERSGHESSIMRVCPDEAEWEDGTCSAGIGQALWDENAPGPSSSISKSVCAATLDISDDEEASGSTALVGLQGKQPAEGTSKLSQLYSGTDKSTYGDKTKDAKKLQPTQFHSFSHTDVSGYARAFPVGQGQKRWKPQDRSKARSLRSRKCMTSRDPNRSRSRSGDLSRGRSESTDSAYCSGDEEDKSTYPWDRNIINMISTDQGAQKYRKQTQARARHPRQSARPGCRMQSLSVWTNCPTEIQHNMRRKRSRNTSEEIMNDEEATNATGPCKKKKRGEEESHQIPAGDCPFSPPAISTVNKDSDKDKEKQDSTEQDGSVCRSSRAQPREPAMDFLHSSWNTETVVTTGLMKQEVLAWDEDYLSWYFAKSLKI